ncbi:hypothetical protein ACQ4WP_26880 [Janthinobacterium sp. GB4P2]|uniref:hypothetical protein n=1 Tax=Janthinobacterium sp. GB4P2 TaxID=3424189 RepID=UPI003F28EDC9
MKTTRDIVVKTRFNADEYVSFAAKCLAADIPQSKVLRDLAIPWQGIDKAKDIRPIVIIQRPVKGPRKTHFPGPQINHGVSPHRSALF